MPDRGVLRWFVGLLSGPKPQVYWEMPATGQAYLIDKETMTVKMVKGHPNDPTDTDHWHDKNKKTFEILGFRFIEPPPPADQDEIAFAEALGKHDFYGTLGKAAGTMSTMIRMELHRRRMAAMAKKHGGSTAYSDLTPEQQAALLDDDESTPRLDYAGGSEDEGYAAFQEAMELLESPLISTLEKHRVDLEPEEREQIMKAKAVWPFGKKGADSPAIHKAVHQGKTWWWSNTHRCGQVRPTLKGAIKAFHDIVEPSA